MSAWRTRHARAPDDVVRIARDIAAGTGAQLAVTEDVGQAVAGVDFVHTDVWVSMGKAKDVWKDRVALLTPTRSTPRSWRSRGTPR